MIQTKDAKSTSQTEFGRTFKDLPAPRVDHTKDHDLIDSLAITICTLLCTETTKLTVSLKT